MASCATLKMCCSQNLWGIFLNSVRKNLSGHLRTDSSAGDYVATSRTETIDALPEARLGKVILFIEISLPLFFY